MKKVLLVLLVGILVAQSCKKDKEDIEEEVVTITYCSKQKFQTTIADMMKPVSIIEDDSNNIIILGEKQGEICLIKVDTLGAEIWNKSFPDIPGIASEVIALDDNSILISSYINNETETIPPVVTNVWLGRVFSLLEACEMNYQLGDADGYSVKSEMYLTRLDRNGSLLWTNTYNECLGNGNSIIRNSKGDINMATIKLKGRYPELVYDSNGVFQDTVNYFFDKNIVFLYEISKEGNTVWKKEFNNIYNRAFDELFATIEIQETNDNILLKTEKNTFFLTSSGDIEGKYINHEDYCNNKNKVLCADANTVLVSGVNIRHDSILYLVFNYYIQRLDNSQGISWEIETDDVLLDNYDDIFITLSSDSTVISMYKNDGIKQWNSSIISSPTSIINCIKGVSTVMSSNGQLIITRTNAEGEF